MLDVQERLIKNIYSKDSMLSNIIKLMKSFTILRLSTYSTEQNPIKLGATIGDISLLSPKRIFPKMTFSGAGCFPLLEELEKKDTRDIVISGLETHICVQQTAIDLLDLGYNVHICTDSVGSRNKLDHDISIRRMEKAGAIITTTESLIFQICQTAERVEFREISSIVKGS